MTKIHASAVVAKTAELGEDVELGPCAVIGDDVVIGARTRVGAHAVVEGPSSLGSDNVIFPHACIGFAPQDLKYDGEPTRLEIGDRNQIREFATLNRGTVGGGGLTKIGDDNLLMTQSHVAHDSIVGSRCVFANGGTLAGHVLVGDDATIGAYSAVHQFTRVGRHAYIGGFSVVTVDALPFCITVGAKPRAMGLNRVGLTRKGFENHELKELERAYRILLRSKLNTSQAVARIREELGESKLALELVEFVEGSERGYAKAQRAGTRGG